VSLAQAHLRKHEWGLAKLAIEKALSKGKLNNPTEAQQVLLTVYKSMSLKPLPSHLPNPANTFDELNNRGLSV
jgi:hypothetical protein